MVAELFSFYFYTVFRSFGGMLLKKFLLRIMKFASKSVLWEGYLWLEICSSKGYFVGLTCWYSGCNLIWKQSLCRSNQVKRWSLGCRDKERWGGTAETQREAAMRRCREMPCEIRSRDWLERSIYKPGMQRVVSKCQKNIFLHLSEKSLSCQYLGFGLLVSQTENKFLSFWAILVCRTSIW